jgi:hypothetical protein
MNIKISPYEPITPELAATGLLITLKNAATTEGACEGTLKDNAKAHRLRAFQSFFGAPVLVLPSDVEAFLKSRPDIASKHHPKTSPAVPSAGQPATASIPQAHSLSPFPDAENSGGPVGDFGVCITLRSLAHTTPSERALVANALIEVARQINETIPATAGNHLQH